MLLLLDTKQVFTWPSLEKNLSLAAVPRLHVQEGNAAAPSSSLQNGLVVPMLQAVFSMSAGVNAGSPLA